MKEKVTKEEIANRFTYHVPHNDQATRYEAIRAKVRMCAEALNELCPPCRELNIAFTKLDEVVFFANAAIARREK